jgi:hypothetical protein
MYLAENLQLEVRVEVRVIVRLFALGQMRVFDDEMDVQSTDECTSGIALFLVHAQVENSWAAQRRARESCGLGKNMSSRAQINKSGTCLMKIVTPLVGPIGALDGALRSDR